MLRNRVMPQSNRCRNGPLATGASVCMFRRGSAYPRRGGPIVSTAPFSAWESFYVIIGSSAAALTVCKFVVVVLGAEARSIGAGGRRFGTSTVVHFCAVLLMSAILRRAVACGLARRLSLAAVGVRESCTWRSVIRPGPPADALRTVLEDWLWHCVFPLIAYVTLLVAALALQQDPPMCLLWIGATALLLLFIGFTRLDASPTSPRNSRRHREG